MGEMVSIGANGMPGYLAAPDGGGPRAGVLVLHELLGLNDDIRGYVDRFAAEGYTALAPDLYRTGRFRVRCLVQTFRAAMQGEGSAYDDIDAARRWLAGHERGNGQVAVVGFCMGGGLALVSATRGQFTAAAPNYGRLPGDFEAKVAGICPVVASYGGGDRTLRGHAERLEVALAGAGVPHDVKEYPGATHSFMNRHAGASRIMDRLLGLSYDPEAADDAWRRILEFLALHAKA
jgi:carboxymethylenebutenolidase